MVFDLENFPIDSRLIPNDKEVIFQAIPEPLLSQDWVLALAGLLSLIRLRHLPQLLSLRQTPKQLLLQPMHQAYLWDRAYKQKPEPVVNRFNSSIVFVYKCWTQLLSPINLPIHPFPQPLPAFKKMVTF